MAGIERCLGTGGQDHHRGSAWRRGLQDGAVGGGRRAVRQQPVGQDLRQARELQVRACSSVVLLLMLIISFICEQFF